MLFNVGHVGDSTPVTMPAAPVSGSTPVRMAAAPVNRYDFPGYKPIRVSLLVNTIDFNKMLLDN
jgi:hypothetical protein